MAFTLPAMRGLSSQATTVIAVASQLHSIAAGNMIPLYQIAADGQVRPVYLGKTPRKIDY